jgi:hypothetical protein
MLSQSEKPSDADPWVVLERHFLGACDGQSRVFTSSGTFGRHSWRFVHCLSNRRNVLPSKQNRRNPGGIR